MLEHVVIELLNLAGMPTGFGQTRSTSQHGVYRMVFRARDEQVARAALAEGHRLLMAAINDDALRRGRRAARGRRGARQAGRLLPRPEHRLHRRAPPPTAASRTCA